VSALEWRLIWCSNCAAKTLEHTPHGSSTSEPRFQEGPKEAKQAASPIARQKARLVALLLSGTSVGLEAALLAKVATASQWLRSRSPTDTFHTRRAALTRLALVHFAQGPLVPSCPNLSLSLSLSFSLRLAPLERFARPSRLCVCVREPERKGERIQSNCAFPDDGMWLS